jgi:hypothetical protein
MTSSSFPGPDRADLRADCGSCAALCCAAFGFTRSADFPVDKAPGDPCRNLADDFSCTVHESLRPRGYRGCTVFDCAGAGQRVTGQLYGGVDRHQRQDVRVEMFAVFRVVRQLHDLLWYLAEGAVRRFRPEASAALVERIEDAIGQGPTAVLGLDLVGLHGEVRAVMGRRFHGVSLCGADLRGAYLIAADLSGADLDGVDLLGADLRGARVHGADLSGSLFLTQMQVNAAQGDERTRLPVDVVRPSHWGSGGA